MWKKNKGTAYAFWWNFFQLLHVDHKMLDNEVIILVTQSGLEVLSGVISYPRVDKQCFVIFTSQSVVSTLK